MKVSELIQMLEQEDPDAEVEAQGCSQCVNPVIGTTNYEGRVWIDVNPY